MYPGSNLDSSYALGLHGNVNFRQLIDMAVVMPSRLNFYALHLLLKCFAEKMNILEDRIDSQQFHRAFSQDSEQDMESENENPLDFNLNLENEPPLSTNKETSSRKSTRCKGRKTARYRTSETPRKNSEELHDLVSQLSSLASTPRRKKGKNEDPLSLSMTDSFDTAPKAEYSEGKLNSSCRTSPRTGRTLGGLDDHLKKKLSSRKMKMNERLSGGDDEEPKTDEPPKEDKPEDKPEEKPEEKPDDKGDKHEDKPENKALGKPVDKAEDKPEDKAEDKPEDKSEEIKPEETKPEGKSEEKTLEKPEDNAEDTAEDIAIPGEVDEIPSSEKEGEGDANEARDRASEITLTKGDRSKDYSSSVSSEYLVEESLFEESGVKKPSTTLGHANLANLVTRSELDIRLLGLEHITKSAFFHADTHRGLTVMKDQIELSMEHLRILSSFILHLVKDQEQKRKLGVLLGKLIEMRNENVYINGQLCIEELLMKELSYEEHQSEEDELKSADLSFTCSSEQGEEEGLGISDQTLYRNPSSIFREEISKIKEDVCNLYNKITELTANILELDCTKLNEKLDEVFEQNVKNRTNIMNLQTSHEDLKLKVNELFNALEETNKFSQYLDETKANLNDMEMRLAQKGDITLVARKVSHEKLEDTYNEMDRKNCEVKKMVTESERNIIHIIDNLRFTLGVDYFEVLFQKLRQEIEDEICDVRNILQKFLDEQYACVAAGGRQNVMKDLKCLSCNTPCLMKDVRLQGLPNAHATKSLGPIVTYHISTIRKDDDDHVGYACKNITAPPSLKRRPCPPRHAGGKHTTFTRKELVENVFQKRTPINFDV